jgi:hypothetical protein
MRQVDKYVYLDNVPFRKNYFQNRNKTPYGWLTVPVSRHLDTLIKDVQVDPNWFASYWGKFESYYKKYPLYYKYQDSIYCRIKDCKTLAEINYAWIDFFRERFNIENEVVRASELDLKEHKSDLVLEICKKMQAQAYFSGKSGKTYLDLKKFQESDVQIDWFESPFDGDEWSALEFLMLVGDKCLDDPN